MLYNIKTINSLQIDILTAVGRQGGAENVINILGSYLVSLGFSVRVVQLVKSDLDWVHDSMDVVYIYDDIKNYQLSDFYEKYKLLLTDAPSPDLILAIAWPYMSYVAKRATNELGIDATVVSYLHARLQNYINAGFGGAEALAWADAHLAISNIIKNDIEQALDNPQCYRVNNPLNNHYRDVPSKMDPLKLCYVGRLSVEKKIDTLINALAKTSAPYELYIVGDGDMMNELIELSSTLHVKERVHFLGWQADPWEKVRDCSICLLASEYEGFSLTSIEAIAQGKTLIGTPVSGIIELIKPGENGYFFPINGVNDLVNILDLIAEGVLPIINPEICKASSIPFQKDFALEDLAIKIYSLAQKRILTHKDVLLPKISVIIPCYNCENTLNACLNSIIYSNICLASLEIITVNDASTDSTLSMLMDYEARYPENILVVNCEENGRQGKARNIGMNYASGDYIMFCDSDDVIDPNMLLKMVLYAETYSVDIVECELSAFNTDPDFTLCRSYKNNDCILLKENVEDAKAILSQNAINVSTCTKLYRHSFIKNIHIQFPEKMFMEDIYFTQVLMTEVNSIYITKEKLYHYYQNPNSTMHDNKIQNYYMDVFYVSKLAIEELVNRGTFNTYKDILKKALQLRMENLKLCMDSLPVFPEENWREMCDYMEKRFN